MTNDIFDVVLGDIQVRRTAPSGKYLAMITEVKEANNPNNGNKGRELHLRLLEAQSGQDLTDVDLTNEQVRDTIWVTAKSQTIARETIQRIAPDTPENMSMREAFENLRGRNVVIHADLITKNMKGEPLRFPRLQVKAYEAA